MALVGWIFLLVGALLVVGGGCATYLALSGTDVAVLGAPADFARAFDGDLAFYFGVGAIIFGLIVIVIVIVVGVPGIRSGRTPLDSDLDGQSAHRLQDIVGSEEPPLRAPGQEITWTVAADQSGERAGGVSQIYEFHLGGNGVALLGRGWHEPESWGVWSIEDGAQISVPPISLPGSHSNLLELELVRLVGEARRSQSIEILLGIKAPAYLEFGHDEVRKTFAIPLSSAEMQSGFQVKIHGASVASPSSLGVGTDDRTIGVGLVHLAITSRQ